MRRELRIVDAATDDLNPVIQRHIEGAVSHIGVRTAYPFVDRTVAYTACPVLPREPISISLRYVTGIASGKYRLPTQDNREAPSGVLDLDGISIVPDDHESGWFVLNDEDWPAMKSNAAYLQVQQNLPADKVPAVFKSAIVLFVRDAFDGVPRASTERAIDDMLSPWVW